MRLAVILVLSALAATFSSEAADFSYSTKNAFDGKPLPRGEVALLSGAIEPGDTAKFIAFIKRDIERFMKSAGLVLSSPGGDIQEAMLISELVKEAYIPVWVGPASGSCVSACFFIFASSPMRFSAGTVIGIHRPYVHPARVAKLSPSQAETAQKKLNSDVRKYLADLEIPSTLVERMFQHSSSEVHWLTREEVTRSLGRRPIWYEQYLIARCGLDKRLELTADADALAGHTSKVERCGRQLTHADKEAYLKALVK